MFIKIVVDSGENSLTISNSVLLYKTTEKPYEKAN